MGQRTIEGSQKLAKAIKLRRNELGLTIEEAALRACVGTKTWSRYESGASIRKDKYRGICKALNWYGFPEEEENQAEGLNLDEYKKREAWSQNLSDTFGEIAALSFAIGSDMLQDSIREDMNELASMPKGTHIGQLGASWLEPYLPAQFLMRYDYEFLYALNTTVKRLIGIAQWGNTIVAHSVMEELALYLAVCMSHELIEISAIECDEHWDEWVFDVFGDMDLVTCLYSKAYLDEDHEYHFIHWMEEQFYS